MITLAILLLLGLALIVFTIISVVVVGSVGFVIFGDIIVAVLIIAWINIMAFTTSRSISLSGQSIINGITVETYNASVSETNPESMYINQSTVNHEMRKANRAQCRKDRDEFEELAYSIQDEIISKVATAKED